MSRSLPEVLVLGMHYRPELTGNAPYTTGLAEALAADGTHVTVLCSHPHYPEWEIHPGYGAWNSLERINGVAVRRLRHWVPSAPTPAKRLLSELSFGIRQALAGWGRPRSILLISPALFSSAVAMVRAKLTGARVVVWIQDVYSSGLKETGSGSGRAAAVVRWVESKTLRQADAVVLIHEAFRRSVETELGVDPAKISVIRNWSHVSEAAGTRRAQLRERYGWSEGDLVALHAGNQGVKQGLENLVEVARLADDEQAPVRVVLLGDGNQHRTLRERAAGIRSIQFLDSVEDSDFVETLNAADVLVVNEKPGVAEMSVPSKLTSYFAAGRPVLAACSSHGGTAAELQSARAGDRVEPGEPRAFLAALLRLHSDPERCDLFGRNGATYRAQTLTKDAAVAAFTEVLEPDTALDTSHRRNAEPNSFR